MSKSAAIVGATGLVGSFLLEQLLADERYEKVWVYARSESTREHEKLQWITGDLTKDSTFGTGISAEDVFCAIGTTQAKAPDLTHYKNVDYGIPLRTATYGLKGQMKRMLVVSALGANAKSKMFYPRIKGQMEEALQTMAIPQLHIFRPSFILGPRQEFRLGENIGKFLVIALKPLVPKKYRGLEAEHIAMAMIKAANEPGHSVVLETQDIAKLSQ